MYHMIVEKNVTSVFKRLNKGDYEYALSGIGTTIEHRFAGEHCLGGKRTSTAALRFFNPIDSHSVERVKSATNHRVIGRHPPRDWGNAMKER